MIFIRPKSSLEGGRSSEKMEENDEKPQRTVENEEFAPEESQADSKEELLDFEPAKEEVKTPSIGEKGPVGEKRSSGEKGLVNEPGRERAVAAPYVPPTPPAIKHQQPPSTGSDETAQPQKPKPKNFSKELSKEDSQEPKKGKKGIQKIASVSPTKANANAKKNKVAAREKLKEGDVVKSAIFPWRVQKLLGSGGFGDVYKVVKDNNGDKREFAMKTELVEGKKTMLRLKIEVTVLSQCFEIQDPEKRRHFVEYVDRGITDKFKFLVMGLVGPSLEDIRKQFLLKNYCKSTAMQASIQTLRSLKDLHNLGWLHRDIKPANFAVGLLEKENVIYMLDFGIARKIFQGNCREVKKPRVKVQFLGTLRFAARACHHGKDQGRKDDLETWLYMAYDLFDMVQGLPWKKATVRYDVIMAKEKLFLHMFVKPYTLVPKEFKRLCDYIDQLKYEDEPDYVYLHNSLVNMAKENNIKLTDKLEWLGKLKKKQEKPKKMCTIETVSEKSGSDHSGSNEKGNKKGAKKGNVNK